MAAGRPSADIDHPSTYAGAIDCDLHPALPGMHVLLPYLDDYWREMVSVRALDRLNLSLTSYPQNAPLSCRPDWKLEGTTKPGSSQVLRGKRSGAGRPPPSSPRPWPRATRCG